MILLTGASGYLGSQILKGLLTKGKEVLVVKRSFSDVSRIEDELRNCPSIDVDKVEIKSIFQKFKIETIIHTATSYGRKDEGVLDIYATNLKFPLELAYHGGLAGIKSFYNTSTSLPGNLNNYAQSKKQFEGVIKGLSSAFKVVNIRPEYFFGPDDGKTKFIEMLISKMRNKVPYIELTPCTQKRDFFYVEDLVSAYILLLEKEQDLPMQVDFSIGSGQAIVMKELVLRIAELLSYDTDSLKFGALPFRRNEVMFSRANITDILKMGWQPKTDLWEGLKRTIQQSKPKWS